ncbi:hypothetical protein MY11210_001068 [Beauveria gryllotalpidicola]
MQLSRALFILMADLAMAVSDAEPRMEASLIDVPSFRCPKGRCMDHSAAGAYEVATRQLGAGELGPFNSWVAVLALMHNHGIRQDVSKSRCRPREKNFAVTYDHGQKAVSHGHAPPQFRTPKIKARSYDINMDQSAFSSFASVPEPDDPSNPPPALGLASCCSSLN